MFKPGDRCKVRLGARKWVRNRKLRTSVLTVVEVWADTHKFIGRETSRSVGHRVRVRNDDGDTDILALNVLDPA